MMLRDLRTLFGRGCAALLSQDESTLFTESAEHAYASFRDKAAACRNMAIEAMQEVAQVSTVSICAGGHSELNDGWMRVCADGLVGSVTAFGGE